MLGVYNYIHVFMALLQANVLNLEAELIRLKDSLEAEVEQETHRYTNLEAEVEQVSHRYTSLEAEVEQETHGYTSLEATSHNPQL